MAICRLSVNISNNEPILKVQCKIQDIEGMLRIYQLKFNGGIKRIDVIATHKRSLLDRSIVHT